MYSIHVIENGPVKGHSVFVTGGVWKGEKREMETMPPFAGPLEVDVGNRDQALFLRQMQGQKCHL